MLALAGLFLIVRAMILRHPVTNWWMLVLALFLTVLGLYLFLVGVSFGLVPLTESTGRALVEIRNKIPIVLFACAVGYLSTLLEPGLRTVAQQVEETSIGAIRKPFVIHAAAFGFALGAGFGVVRILSPFSMKIAAVGSLVLLLVLVLVAPDHIVGIAFDCASASTGPVNIPILLGLAIGLSQAATGADPVRHGFGLIALTAYGTTTAVMILGIIMEAYK